jgi:hypothetical protein
MDAPTQRQYEVAMTHKHDAALAAYERATGKAAPFRGCVLYRWLEDNAYEWIWFAGWVYLPEWE